MAKATTKIYKVRKPTPGVKDNGDVVDRHGNLRCVACGDELEFHSGDMECPNLCGIDEDMPLEAKSHPSWTGKGPAHKGPFNECHRCIRAVTGVA